MGVPMNPYMILDFIRLSLKALSERRARALLTTVGISIGPLVLVMMSSVVGGYSDYIVERVTSLGQNAIAIFPNENYRISEEDLQFVRSI
ncbi:MAG: ABC transporter permease, partial [Candidatus Bathyarchaeia archaeon]